METKINRVLLICVVILLGFVSCFVSVAAAGDSYVLPYPNEVIHKLCPLGNSIIVYSSGMHYVPEKDRSDYSIGEQKGDYFVINLFADNEKVAGKKIKSYSQFITDNKTGQKYLALTFINAKTAESNYLTINGMKEIDRDISKLAKAERLNDTYVNVDFRGEKQIVKLSTHIRRIDNFYRQGIKLVRKHSSGNDGKSPITFLYEIQA